MAIINQNTDHNILAKIIPKKWPKLYQLKYLGHFLNLKEKRILIIAGIIALLSLLILLVRLPSGALKSVPATGGNYNEGVVGAPQHINPILAKNDVDIDLTKLIFSGLLKYNENFEPTPDLAETIQLDEQKTRYKIALKNKIFWHDGQPITTNDIVFTINTIKNQQINSPWFDYFAKVKVVPTDSQNIELILEKPISGFSRALTIGLLPEHIWKDIPTKQFSLTEYNLKPVGSGPYKFDKLQKNSTGQIRAYFLKRYDKFYGSGPYLNRVTFRFYPDFDELLKAAKKKELSGIGYSPKAQQNQISLSGSFKKYSLQLPHYTAIFFNPNNNNQLASKAIRKALAYTVPRDKIFNDILVQEGQLIYGPILPLAPYYTDELIKYNFDLDRASKLLEAAGWQKQEDGYWHQKDKILEITLTTVQQPELEAIGQIIQKSWQDLGIKTRLITAPTDIITKEIIAPRQYEALIFGVVKRFDTNLEMLWHSSQIKHPGLNLSLITNPRVDELLDKINNSPYEEVRQKKYTEFQKIINDDLPVIFLYSTPYNYLVNKNIKGININKINIPSDRLNNISNWYIKTKKVIK